MAEPKPLGRRIVRRVTAEAANLRRLIALIGWRRSVGPPVTGGIEVAPDEEHGAPT